MFGLTNLGTVHTVVGLVALVAGLLAFVRRGEIRRDERAGQVYIVATVLTCVSGFGIFQRGGFNIAHVLGLLTLAVLALPTLDARWKIFGRWSAYGVVACYSLTYFFHWVPGITETFTRFPLGAPLFSNPEDPALQKTLGVVLLVALAGIALQWRRLWRQRRAVAASAAATGTA